MAESRRCMRADYATWNRCHKGEKPICGVAERAGAEAFNASVASCPARRVHHP